MMGKFCKITTRPMWQLNTWNAPSETGELSFFITFNLNDLNRNSHIFKQLAATMLDSAWPWENQRFCLPKNGTKLFLWLRKGEQRGRQIKDVSYAGKKKWVCSCHVTLAFIGYTLLMATLLDWVRRAHLNYEALKFTSPCKCPDLSRSLHWPDEAENCQIS